MDFLPTSQNTAGDGRQDGKGKGAYLYRFLSNSFPMAVDNLSVESFPKFDLHLVDLDIAG